MDVDDGRLSEKAEADGMMHAGMLNLPHAAARRSPPDATLITLPLNSEESFLLFIDGGEQLWRILVTAKEV
jgi:hypothetical protein